MNYFILAKIGKRNMKKTFQKTLIAASVGAVLAAASMVASAGTPGTTNLLFPYITTKASAYSFLSIVNQQGVGVARPIHFTYAVKSISAANSATCTHINGDAFATPNDLMQFEVSKKFDLPTLTGDVTSLPKYFPSGAVGANQHGFLIANNDVLASYGETPLGGYAGATLHGEAHIVDTDSGLYLSYASDDLHTAGAAFPDFGSTAGPDGGNHIKNLSWFADSIATTQFYLLPLGTEGTMAYGGNATANYVAVGQNIGGTYFFGHFNNNEGFQSSTTTVPVTCFGFATRSQMLGTLNAPWSATGGWANWYNTLLNNALVYKQETTSALGGTRSFMTRAAPL